MNENVVIILLAVLLLLLAYLIFRVIVRREYAEQGRLGKFASTAQLLIFAGLFCFPYVFLPPEWPWFWEQLEASFSRMAGFILILLGFGLAFGTMAWFGIRRAFGLHADALIQTGPYRFSRNPQILGGYLLIIGTALQWPSWYSLAWIGMYGVIGHWMILSEEEHLSSLFGNEYLNYCEAVPRYFLRWSLKAD